MILNNIEVVVQGSDEISLPKMLKVQQKYSRKKIENIHSHITERMKPYSGAIDYKGKRIAIAVGSRGITDIVEIILAITEVLKSWGAKPFIVPSMGSHGGASAEGQKEVLRSYNVTEFKLHVPIISSMDVVHLGDTNNGCPVYFSKDAYEADGTIVVNKIKPHTDFKGKHESGLVKMIAIGLGKHKGAAAAHEYGFEGFSDLIEEIAGISLGKTNIICGVAIMQDAYEDTSEIIFASKNKIIEADAKILPIAKENMARLLIPNIDLLVVREIGKNISGAGMDPNVTGRPSSGLLNGFENTPNIDKILVSRIAGKSYGNAVGIGMADLTTVDCMENINLSSTYTNAVSARMDNAAKIPMILPNDLEAMKMALYLSLNVRKPSEAKIVAIRNTSYLRSIYISEACYDEVKYNPNISVMEEAASIPFVDGHLAFNFVD